MKKILFLSLISIFILLTACKKEDANDTQLVNQILTSPQKTLIDPSDLPTDILEDLENYNFDSYIEEAWSAGLRGFQIIMGDEEMIFFTQKGRRLEHSGRRFLLDEDGPCRNRGILIPRDKLPVNIVEYITTNFPDHSIIIGKKRHEVIAVLLAPRLVLLFDVDGNFLEEMPGFIHCPALCHPIFPEDLHADIKNYITTNYPDADVKRACIRRGNYITVGVLTPDGPMVLVFDKNNNFLFKRP